jgi:phosphopantothenoylcysteine decarboxylase/phosphopantothenate--cysteine ligase
MSKPRILFQLTGSIACFKACSLISKLVQNGYEVQTVASLGALEFIGKATLEGLTGRPVFVDIYEPNRAMDHIHLNRWADLALLCPASASTLNKLANGMGDDAVGALFLSYQLNEKPYWIAPAMNHLMYLHPATQESIQKLQSWKVRILHPESGHQACGEEGPGRLMEPEKIFAAIEEFFAGRLRREE